MTVEKNGGPAFPQTSLTPEGGTLHERGMTLADWFAGQAIQVVSQRTTIPEYELKAIFGERTGIRREEIIAALAYKHADAMLKARGQP